MTWTEKRTAPKPTAAATRTAPAAVWEKVLTICSRRILTTWSKWGPGMARKGEQTRQRIVEAAYETLRTRGFHAATSRAIGDVGGFNPALTFYHFGSVHELLLSALEHASAGRLERYADEARAARGAEELLALMRRIYREDVESGFVRVA